MRNVARDLRKRAQRFCRVRGEQLERRDLLTSTLYVDFGDAFPGGLLGGTPTVGQLAAKPGPNGPTLSQAGASFPANTPFTLASYNSVYGAQSFGNRQAIMEIVRRAYAPFDITVVELRANFQNVDGFNVRGAQSLANIGPTMAANEVRLEDNDGYVLVGRIGIGAADFNPTLTEYGGLADGDDLNARQNNSDDTALVLLNNAAEGNLQSNFFVANQIVHEAGHLFGLRHAFGNSPADPPAGSAINPLLPESDIMSYRSYGGANDAFTFISRYPTVLGDGNLNNNVLTTFPGTNSPADQLLNDPQVGPSNFTYVTGTGAHDLIRIVKINDGQAQVIVEAFNNNNLTGPIPVPRLGGTAFTYVIDLDRSIRVDGGLRDDRIVIQEELGVRVDIFGMAGTDQLVVLAAEGGAALYTPGSISIGLDGNPDFRGSVEFGNSTVIVFREFEANSRINLFGFQVNIVSPGRVLVAGGSQTHDVILVESLGGQVRVLRNHVEKGRYDVRGIVLIGSRGLAGDDTIIVDHDFAIRSRIFGDDGIDSLFGGRGRDFLLGGNDTDHLYGLDGDDLLLGFAGDDHLYGGNGRDGLAGMGGDDFLYGEGDADVLTGGGGSDHLFGGLGRDVLIGGNGRDFLFGESNDDLLIAGSTAFDVNVAALQALLLEWNSNRSYNQRVNNVRNGTGPILGGTGVRLLRGLTVSNDFDADDAYGGGELDYFIGDPGDRALDLVPGERVN